MFIRFGLLETENLQVKIHSPFFFFLGEKLLFKCSNEVLTAYAEPLKLVALLCLSN